MKTHTQIVAALHIALGVLSLLGALIIFVVFMGLAGGVMLTDGHQGNTDAQVGAGVLGILAIVIGCFLALLALPGIIGGWALYAGRSWARPVVIVLGILHLMNIPFGTALGIYTLWALLYEPQ